MTARPEASLPLSRTPPPRRIQILKIRVHPRKPHRRVAGLNAAFTTYGTIAPGSGIGTLSVTGNATFGPDAQLATEIGGASFDVLAVSGSAALATVDGRGSYHFVIDNGTESPIPTPCHEPADR